MKKCCAIPNRPVQRGPLAEKTFSLSPDTRHTSGDNSGQGHRHPDGLPVRCNTLPVMSPLIAACEKPAI